AGDHRSRRARPAARSTGLSSGRTDPGEPGCHPVPCLDAGRGTTQGRASDRKAIIDLDVLGLLRDRLGCARDARIPASPAATPYLVSTPVGGPPRGEP